jgi:hypothetical protein
LLWETISHGMSLVISVSPFTFWMWWSHGYLGTWLNHSSTSQVLRKYFEIYISSKSKKNDSEMMIFETILQISLQNSKSEPWSDP